MAIKMEPEFTGMHTLYFQLSGNEKVEGPPNVYMIIIVIGLYEADPIAHKKRVKEFKAIVEENVEIPIEEINLVPDPPRIGSSDDWWNRRSYSERKSQLRVAPFTSDGFIKISFTKPVVFPKNIIDLIKDQ